FTGCAGWPGRACRRGRRSTSAPATQVSSRGKQMTSRWGVALFCLGVLGVAAWLGGAGLGKDKTPADWTEVTGGVWRSRELPAAHALIDGDAALLIDAPRPPAGPAQ